MQAVHHGPDWGHAGADELVELLGDEHRSFAAYRRLLDMGPDAASAARAGLGHASPRVRERCCQVLDHTLDAASIPALIDALDDEVAGVRVAALHALACERCTVGSCRPDADQVLPVAIDILGEDVDAHVRAMAVELVGVFVHTRDDALAALQRAAASDFSSAVRKKASWYVPGGPVFTRTSPRRRR